MNKLTGVITKVDCDDHLSIVEVDVHGQRMKSIVIETPESAPFLKTGSEIEVIFKETEVSIAKDFSGGISLQNKMGCRIKSIQQGKLLSRILLDFKGFEVISIITSAAVHQLELKADDQVTALVKTNEIMIAPR